VLHTEVCVLYPDAKPLQVTAEVGSGTTMIHYQSHRPMAAIAHGLVEVCMAHYSDPRTLEWNFADENSP